jgi:ankyrin repeat protein
MNPSYYLGWSALHEAACYGWYETAKILLEAGANVNMCGPGDETPLHDASSNSHKKVL